MKTYLYLIIIAFGLSIFSCRPNLKKELKVPDLFSDHMVLQQQQDVNFWGAYTPGKKISVSGSWGEETTAITDAGGQWTLKLATPNAGGPYTVKIISRDSTITIDDVLIGEVWLASGQSNMEMPLKGWPPNDTILNADQEILQANYSNIRMLTVPKKISRSPLDTISSQWIAATAETAGDFSATAYFFAKRLHKALNIPIGIIHSSWGGTPAEAWTSKEKIKKLGDFDDQIKTIENPQTLNAIDKWFNERPVQEIPETDQQWQDLSFSDLALATPDFDDAGWETIVLPGRYDAINSVEFDGAVWLRNTFDVQDVSVDYVLQIGAIDDMDATFVNGQKIGGLVGAGFWNVAREMTIPKKLLVKGKNTIAIRALDTGGNGAVSGPMSITSKKGETISIEGAWKRHLVSEIYKGRFYVYDLQTDLSNRPDVLQVNQNLPTVLFNAMINPLVQYTIKGAIWYQGESNVGRDEQYKKLFPAMIEDWRDRWGYEFPFYFVQIAPFMYNPNPEEQVSQKLRDAQRLALKTPKTGMVVTLDIGNATNIHPANKQDVGKRLAGLALANDYKKELVASGPLYKSLEKSENKLIVTFDHVGTGLHQADTVLTGFEIAGADKVYLPAQAMIVGDKVEVSNSSIATPKYVRYAWRDTSEASLFNREGLPASSFSSEAE
ncbi:MAG: sialate O-acetylesterase [Flavobacteriaceae bacterium]|nr:sialate O-acetylesterase [Flavobacteriaceae bacterium]